MYLSVTQKIYKSALQLQLFIQKRKYYGNVEREKSIQVAYTKLLSDSSSLVP